MDRIEVSKHSRQFTTALTVNDASDQHSFGILPNPLNVSVHRGSIFRATRAEQCEFTAMRYDTR
jgi:hypothetical protein